MSIPFFASWQTTKVSPLVPTSSGILQRQCACGEHTSAGGECEECRQKRGGTLQRAAVNTASTRGVPPIVHDVLSSSGQPLDEGTRAFMEPRFGYDFSNVSVHTDAQAAESARSVNALAYTVGRDVVFGTGQYEPGTMTGKRLLAHELTHVVQQKASTNSIDHSTSSNVAAETEANAMADTLTTRMSGILTPQVMTGIRLARQKLSEEPIPKIEREDLPIMTLPFLDAPAEREVERLGTARTTAPIAKESIKPQNIMTEELAHELQVFSQAKVVLTWIEGKRSAEHTSTGTTAEAFKFAAEDLFGDQSTMKRLQPVPKSATDLKPILDLLVFYGVLQAPTQQEPKYVVVTDTKTGKVMTDRLNKANADIERFTRQFKDRVKKRDPLDPTVTTDVIPMEWSSDQGQVKEERKAEEKLSKLKSQPSEEAKAQQAIRSAEENLRTGRRYRTFAKSVVELLTRLRAINSNWSAGTYATHEWGEFSVDVFLNAAEVDIRTGRFPGFYWKQDDVRKFFDDLNTAAEQKDTSTGRFAWRAIYNDTDLAAEIDKKYGNGRVIQAPNHGPNPDHKLHIHLDITPVDFKKDAVTGYEIRDGRVQLLNSQP